MISFKSCVQLILNYSGVGYTFGSIILLLTVNAYFACPALYGDEQCRAPIALGYFILFEILINFAFFHYNAKYNRVTSLLPDASRISAGDPRATQYRQFCNNSDPPYLSYSNQNGATALTTTASYLQQQRQQSDLNANGQVHQQQPLNGGMSSSVKGYTKYCYTCEMTVPQRCHHCPVCNYCILKKDHHCFLTGACVGFGNQRYFLVFLFWACIGATYGTVYSARYLNEFYQPMFPFGFIDYIFPLAMKKWLFLRHCTVIQLGMIMVFTFGAAGAGTSATFFITQWYYILKGQTMFEHMKKEKITDGSSMRQRVAVIFGPYWYLNFLFPMPFKNKLDETFKKIVYDYYVKEL